MFPIPTQGLMGSLSGSDITAGITLALTFLGATTLDSRITFSRGTNATLTGSNGLIQYAPHNLLTNSESFEAAAWEKLTGGTGIAPVVTSNAAVAPDGTSTADRIVFDRGAGTTSADISYINQSITAFTATATSSIYLMTTDGTTKQLQLRCGAPAAQVITVTGTWQRFQVTSTNATIDRLQLLHYGAGDDPAQTVSVFVWGAQLNVGSTAQSYNSTTPKNLLGFTQEPENAAWTKSNSYIQQNLLTWSQDFDNAAWAKSDVTVTANAAIAPDGSLTADKLIESFGVNRGNVNSTTVSVGQTISVYAKAGEWTHVALGASNNTGLWAVTTFNLSTGAVAGGASYGGNAVSNATITAAGNGWFRCSVQITALGGASRGTIMPFNQSGDPVNPVPALNGDGTSGIYVWGAQLVQGSTAGDYTQTTSAAAPTRYLNWDGTLTGRKLVEDTTSAVHVVYASTAVAAVPYTLSMYAKPAERNFARLDFVTLSYAAGSTVILNLTTGVTTITNYGATTGTTATAVSIGGGWYRLTMTVQATAATYFSQIGLSSTNSTGSYTGDGTSGIYVSDFQLSNSASVDPYVYNPQAAAASAAYYGPRFDYNPTGTPVLSGVELVTNGTFDSGTTTGWTADANAGGTPVATLSVVSGRLRVACGVGGGRTGFATQSFTTIPGRLYQYRATGYTGTASFSLRAGSTIRGFDYVDVSPTTGVPYSAIFTATTTTTYLSLVEGSLVEGQYAEFDNISVQEVTGYTATANGLLIEEQRTNLLTYSQDFSNVTAWPPTNITVTNAATTAPDGTNTAQSIAATTTAATLLVSATATVSATSATYSVYAKQGTGANSANTFILRNNTTATNLLAGTLNYSTGVFTYTIGSTGVSVQNAGNGWWRLIMTVTSGVTAGDGLRGYVGFSGASETAGTFLYAWGAQLEAGSFATSYIPTVASQVTRNADSASMLGDNFYTWYNVNQGTFSVEADNPALGNLWILDANNSTANEEIRLATTGTSGSLVVWQNGVVQANITVGTTVANVPFKMTAGYAFNNTNAALNGAIGTTDTSFLLPSPNRLQIGASFAAYLNGHIRRIGYYNTRLPDSTLQALTT